MLLEMWYQALASPRGVCVRVDEGDVEGVRQKLYAARREAADEDLKTLSLVISPTTPNEIWIVKREP